MYVRIVNGHKPTLTSDKLVINLLNLIKRPGVLVELEVLAAISVFEVTPKYVNREVIVREVVISLDHQVRAVWLPAAVVKAQTMDRREWCVASDLRQTSLIHFWTLRRGEDKTLKLASNRAENVFDAILIISLRDD
jgi:hypothetical protein